MEQFCRDYLLALAKAFAKAEKLQLSTVSQRFYGRDHFLHAYQHGAVTMTLRKFDEMLEAFARQWPDGAAWPSATIRLHKGCVKNGAGMRTTNCESANRTSSRGKRRTR